MSTELDSFLDRPAIREITTLSYPTISRMQRAGRFPQFEQISLGRVGLRKSVLVEFLEGLRDWATSRAGSRSVRPFLFMRDRCAGPGGVSGAQTGMVSAPGS